MARESARNSPARIRRTSSWMWLFEVTLDSFSPISLVFQDLPRDDQPLDFAGAFADGAQLHMAIELLGGIVFDESVAAVNLHALVGTADSHFTCVELCHRGFERGLHPRIFHGSSAMREQTGSIDLGCQIGELECNGLKFADRFAKLLALLRVLQRGFIRALRHAESKCGDGNAATIESAHGIDETFAFMSQ